MSSSKKVGARAAILAAARRLLEAGHTQVGLEEVAREAGVSRQAVYLHFGSRTKLLLALVDDMDSERLPELLGKVFAARTAPAALDAMVDVCAVYTEEILGVANALDSARRSESAAAAAWNDRMTRRRHGFGLVVAGLAKEGLLTRRLTEEEATDLLFAVMSIRVWEDLVVVRGWSKKRYARHLKRILRRALVRRPAGTAGRP
jgi:AcrR family transcriptional regulator